MYIEMPSFKRCCFCMPLRLGLVAFGYTRIIVVLLLLYFYNFESWYPYHTVIFIWVFSALDIFLNVVFVIGAHLKNLKIIKIYYYYSIVGLIIYIIYDLYLLAAGLYLISNAKKVDPVLAATVIGGQTVLEVLLIILQIYLILLTKSEIFKLENNLKFKFMKVTGEAACSLEEDDKETKDNVKYDRIHSETIYPNSV